MPTRTTPRRSSRPAAADVRAAEIHDKIVHAEAEAARHLGNYNAARERGTLVAAAKHLARAQRWLDKANDLRGWGST